MCVYLCGSIITLRTGDRIQETVARGQQSVVKSAAGLKYPLGSHCFIASQEDQ
jgi:hypothetical protein